MTRRHAKGHLGSPAGHFVAHRRSNEGTSIDGLPIEAYTHEDPEDSDEVRFYDFCCHPGLGPLLGWRGGSDNTDADTVGV